MSDEISQMAPGLIKAFAPPEEENNEGGRRRRRTAADEAISALRSWTPKTRLGREVMAGRIITFEAALASGLPIREVQIVDALIPNLEDEVITEMCKKLEFTKDKLKESCYWLKKTYLENPEKAASGATPFLNMFGWTLGGWIMVKSATQANILLRNDSSEFLKEKIHTATFFCDTYLPIAASFESTITSSYKSLSIIN